MRWIGIAGCVMALGLVGLAGAVPAPTVDQTRMGTDKLPPQPLRDNGLAITKKKYDNKRVVFSVAVPGRMTSETLVALGEYQVSFCTNDDISGGGAPNSACKGISRYTYTPKVRTRVILAAAPGDTGGTPLSDWKTTDCRNPTHHCPIPFRTDFTGGAGGGYVNVITAADSGGKKVDGDDVLDVERKGKLDVIRIGANRRPEDKSFVDKKLNANQLKVVTNGSKAKIAFSVKVPHVKRGDVLEVGANLSVSKRSNYPFNPLVTTKISGNGHPIVGVNGPNCTGTCQIVDAGALRVKKSGNVRVRLYARAVRNNPQAAGGTVTLNSGALAVIRHRAR